LYFTTLAASVAALFALVSARNVSTKRPFEPLSTASLRGKGWTLAAFLMRAFLVVLRSIPEYIWAYVLLAMLGATAWPAILALAIHNAGILGKLGAETIENLESKSLFALRQLGASRAEVVVAGVFPLSLSRYLLYVFYRFETCVREATVLGMLGVISLGYWIQDARARQFYDQMILFVMLGALIVLVADLFSAFVRSRLRRAA
jgi:phosphonate transport system permease protein